MIENFPLVSQPPGSNSCLPTVIYAVLRCQGRTVSQQEVSQWCHEDPDGCLLDLAIAGLRDQEIDVDELPQDDFDSVRAYVTDEEEPQPVIVTIKTPFVPSLMDHAVVVLDVRQIEGQEFMAYMDPLTGQVKQEKSTLFQTYWSLAGGQAFIIYP